MSKEIHRFIDTDILPRKGKLISFKDSIGLKLDFEYNDIKDKVCIEAYDPKTHMLQISFPNITKDKLFSIHSDNFKQVKFGNMIDNDTITYGYKYDIGDVIKCNMGNVTILDKRTGFVGVNKDIKRRFYYIECNLCHNKRWVEASILNKHTNQFCDKCGIHTYYPEKFLSNLLDQLKIPYIHQFNKKHESWCKEYLYDFLIQIDGKKIIIETNGNQHYSKIWTITKHTLEEIQQNDANKYKLALENGIDHYIVIDCRKSTLKWIKNSILNGSLLSVLNINESDIDWDKCHEFATSDFVRIAAELYNNGFSTKEIEKELKKSSQTILHYLKTAFDLHLCNSVPDNRNFVPITVYGKNGKIGDFKTITDAENMLRNSFNTVICKRTIRNYLDTGKIYKGFSFYRCQKGEETA